MSGFLSSLSDWRIFLVGIVSVFSTGAFVGPTINNIIYEQPKILQQTAERVEAQERQIITITEAVKRNSESITDLANVIKSWRPDTTPPIEFNASKSSFPDTKAGETSNITWNVTRLRDGCWVDELQVFFVDSSDVTQGYVVNTMPGVNLPIKTSALITYPITVPVNMQPGRANVFVEITYKCEDGFQTEVQSPYLAFDVLPRG